MSIFDRFLSFFNLQTRARRNPPVSIPVLPGGRASIDVTGQFPTSTWFVQAPQNYETNWELLTIDSKALETYNPLKLMEVLADLSPEVSRALWDFLRLCNPGWEATAKVGDTQNAQGQAALDVFIKALEDRYGTFDVVLGRIYTGAFLRGGFCAELVLDEFGRMPLDIATPDPASIRFQRRTDKVLGPIWQAGQWQSSGFVSLDRETFRYIPVDPMPGSPYGRPPAAPALFSCLFLLGMLHDLKRVIQQQGYPRLDLSIDVQQMIEQMPQLAADPSAFEAFVGQMVASVSQAYSDLAPDDAYIHTSNVTVNKPVGAADSGSLAGIDAVITMLERMAVRALKTMPLMMGITEATGDIQSNRQYEIFSAGIKSLQHYAETILSRLLTLALQAQGIQSEVEFCFAELRASEELRDAQTEQLKIGNEINKVQQGWTSNDEAAEAITGHPAVNEPERMTQPQPQQPGIGNTDGGEAVPNATQNNANWWTEIRIARDEVAKVRESLNGYH